MDEMHGVVFDVRSTLTKEGVKIAVIWNVAHIFDLDLLRSCGLGEAAIESKQAHAGHVINVTGAAPTIRAQALALAAYFTAVAGKDSEAEAAADA